MIRRWISTPAQWWQFWMPMSGPIGGTIMGLVIFGLLPWLFW